MKCPAVCGLELFVFFALLRSKVRKDFARIKFNNFANEDILEHNGSVCSLLTQNISGLPFFAELLSRTNLDHEYSDYESLRVLKK